MKASLLLLLPATIALCQAPTQINVTVIQPRDYMTPFYQSLRDSVTATNNAAHLAIEEESLRLQRERLRFEERQAEDNRRVPPSYREVHPNEAQWRINQDMKDAIKTCRAVHDDCQTLDGMMNVIAGALQPDWKQLTMTEYVECLYVIAKHATFGETARQIIAQTPDPKAPSR